MYMDHDLFNVEMAENAWNKLSEKYSHRYDDTFSAWSRLSYSMRHSYSRHYDGGLLRVIAFFGESFPEHLTDDRVMFQAGPATDSISINPYADDQAERYLLLQMAKVFSEDEYLNRYIKEYTNASHREAKIPGRHTMFDRLRDMLVSELIQAERKNDAAAFIQLRQLAGMMVALSNMVF